MPDQEQLTHAATAFDHITARLIRRKARRLVGQAGLRPQDRRDLEQELTVELLARRDRYDPDRGTWLAFARKVLDRTGSNIVRFRRAAKGDGQRLEPLDEEFPPAVEDESVDLDLDLAAAVERLPAEYRTIVTLVRRIGVIGAAQVLGVHRSTVYARLHELRDHEAVAPLMTYHRPSDSPQPHRVIPV